MREMIERFWAKVDRRGPDECWPWTGAKDVAGYARISYKRKNTPASRIALMLAGGMAELPPTGQYALHRCDNPACVNPRHLYWGTHGQNMRDAVARGRLSTGDSHIFRREPERCARGEGKPLTAKLTESDVREVRASALSQRALAERLGVNQSQISNIRRRKSWRHV